MNLRLPSLLTACVLFTAMVIGGPLTAHGEPRILGVCQDLLGERTSCEATTQWSVLKTTDTPVVEPMTDGRARFKITVTEGETAYALEIGSVMTLTGLIPVGTEIRGLVVSLQKGVGDGFTSVASGGFGDTSETCGCPFVDNGELDVSLKTLQGAPIDVVEGSVIEYLPYGDHVRVEISAAYDLSSAVVRPGDTLRLQTCVSYIAGDELAGSGCVGEGGNTRTIKACNPFDFETYHAPGDVQVQLSDELGAPADAFVTLSSFEATPGIDASHVSPQTPQSLLRGGGPTRWEIPAVEPGHQTVIAVEGTVFCAVDASCENPEGAYCMSRFDNRASLEHEDGSGTWSSAEIIVSCLRAECTNVEAAVCDDGNPCTEDSCDPQAGCLNNPVVAACDDGNYCTVDDICGDGVCAGGPRDCSDGNICTRDACDDVLGCTSEALDGAGCSDSDACTKFDRCEGDLCVGETIVCDDDNPCTADSCDSVVGCVNTPTAGPCDDGALCTSDDYCDAGQCKPGSPAVCGDDGNTCTDASCVEGLGCQQVPRNGGACEDGSVCSTRDVCVQGQCVAGPPLPCDDMEQCTDDSCDPALGCVFTTRDDGSVCDDGSNCTQNDQCFAGLCASNQDVPCDDGNPCTQEVCDPNTGCSSTPIDGAPCSDGNICTEQERCVEGVCGAGEALDCDDNDPCTVDTCTEAGCLHESAVDGLACDDGDACTLSDICLAGRCGGITEDCDDNDPCTIGACDSAVGCTYVPSDGDCDDGDPCTLGGSCVGGTCFSGAPNLCDDGQSCTTDSCQPGVGCVNQPLNDREACDDGDACTGCPWTDANVLRGFSVTPAFNSPGLSFGPDGYIVWFVGLFRSNLRVKMNGENVRLLVFEDGSAVLKGRVTVTESEGDALVTYDTWDLVLNFTGRGQGALGQGFTGPKRELIAGYQTGEYTDLWHYFELTDGRMDAVGGSAYITMTKRPADGRYPFQIGERANNRNLAVGGSTWFDFVLNDGWIQRTGYGDANIDLEEIFCSGVEVCRDGACSTADLLPICAELAVGDYCTYLQEDYGRVCDNSRDEHAGCVLANNFGHLLNGANCLGVPAFVAGFTGGRRHQAFTNPNQLTALLPTYGTGFGPTSSWGACAAPLTQASPLVGRMLALKMSVRLSDARVLPAAYGMPLGDLELISGPCVGLSVREVLLRAETRYAGMVTEGGACRSATDLRQALLEINMNFEGCQRDLGILQAPLP